ncbi:hypothetical protein GCM10010156_73110 [Planobispora rosea]|uniref:Uncharacterized protein n=1 Tax=Planobispora rosea TaxID=35762 RepID=A0A8J3WHN1_PLARO|nr:hypothetical protein GCM10010156_73110 [Planobispora rosea]GIH88877.1 hypothetical protein Pro02_72850 [Planobispora rosea]
MKGDCGAQAETVRSAARQAKVCAVVRIRAPLRRWEEGGRTDGGGGREGPGHGRSRDRWRVGPVDGSQVGIGSAPARGSG